MKTTKKNKKQSKKIVKKAPRETIMFTSRQKIQLAEIIQNVLNRLETKYPDGNSRVEGTIAELISCFRTLFKRVLSDFHAASLIADVEDEIRDNISKKLKPFKK